MLCPGCCTFVGLRAFLTQVCVSNVIGRTSPFLFVDFNISLFLKIAAY